MARRNYGPGVIGQANRDYDEQQHLLNTPIAMPVNRPGAQGGGQILPGIEYEGMNYSAYNPIFDPKTMSSLGDYERMLNMNSAGYKKFSDFALSKGPSSWADTSKRASMLNDLDAREKLARETNGQTALAMSNLASQGGLSSGARERAAEGGRNAYVSGAQDINRQTSKNNLQIAMQDEEQKLNALGALPGIEQQRVSGWTDVKQKDIANQMAENKNLQDYNYQLSNLQQQAIAAQKQADATRASGGKK